MRLSSNTLWKTAGALFAVSWLVFVVVAAIGVGMSPDGTLILPASRVAAIALLGVMASVIVMGAAWALDWWHAYPFRRPLVRLNPMEKPPGWNKRVLWWFFNGPERREPTDAYREAFRERLGSTTFNRPWGGFGANVTHHCAVHNYAGHSPCPDCQAAAWREA